MEAIADCMEGAFFNAIDSSASCKFHFDRCNNMLEYGCVVFSFVFRWRINTSFFFQELLIILVAHSDTKVSMLWVWSG